VDGTSVIPGVHLNIMLYVGHGGRLSLALPRSTSSIRGSAAAPTCLMPKNNHACLQGSAGTFQELAPGHGAHLDNTSGSGVAPATVAGQPGADDANQRLRTTGYHDGAT